MSIKELIAAAYNKDATAFESAFQSVMQDKVSAAVENAFTAEEVEEDLDEEVEELDELSGKTLGSYVVKASKDSAASMKKREDAIDAGDRDTARKMGMRARKHEHGSRKAIDKLTGSGFAKVHATEEVEELDELSKKTLGSYVKKSGGAGKEGLAYAVKSQMTAAHMGDREDYKKSQRQANNRSTGIQRAADRLTKEEVEELDELSTSTLKSYRTAAWKDAGKAYTASDSSRKSDSEREAAFKRGDKRMAGYELATAKTGAKPNKTYQHSGVGSIPNAKVKSTNEEVEALDELSKKTLGSYKQSAQADQRIARKQFDASHAHGDYAGMDAAAKSYNKRKAGLAMANKKMSEETEE